MIIVVLIHAERALNVTLVPLFDEHGLLLEWMGVSELALVVSILRLSGSHFTKLIIMVILMISKMSSDELISKITPY
jgi:hypothetical protein